MKKNRRHRWTAGGVLVLANMLLALVMSSYASAGGGSLCKTEMDDCHCGPDEGQCSDQGNELNDKCIVAFWTDSTGEHHSTKIWDKLSEEFVNEPCPLET